MLTMNPAAFMFADRVLELALKEDPKNTRAQFYKALVKPLVALKGIANRVKPIATSTAESKAHYDETIAKMDAQTPESLRVFLTDGPQDIATEKDIQRFIDEQTAAWDGIRLFMKANKESGLVLYAPTTLSIALGAQEKWCDASQDQNGVVTYRLCTVHEKTEFKLAAADAEALQHVAAAIVVYQTLLNHRDLSGVIAVINKFKNQNVNGEVVYNELTKNKDFSVLRNAGGMKALVGMGLDVISGLRYVLKMQASLCPANKADLGQRNEKGQPYGGARAGYVFANGMCLSPTDSKGHSVEYVWKTVELALNGGNYNSTYEINRNGTISERSIMTRPAMLLTNPIQDLKTLKFKFNACGQINQLSDDTLGGALPAGGANQYLTDVDTCNM